MKAFILNITICCIANFVYAQYTNPVYWKIQSKKINDNTFEIHCNAQIMPPWHIYSQDNNVDVATPTVVAFNNNPEIELIGKTREVGTLLSDTISGTVLKYYTGEVDFIQIIKLRTLNCQIVNGRISWVACSEKCLPEADRNFSLTIGGGIK